MNLLVVIINEEELLDELITGWLDLGVTGATVIESTDSLQFISHHVPIFAGFRALTSGGMRHNKTIFTVIETPHILDEAVAFLEALCCKAGAPHQGVYFVMSLDRFNRLGREIDDGEQQRHVEKKIGRPIKGKHEHT